MNPRIFSITTCLLLVFCLQLPAQKEWTLKEDKEGIKVYMRNIEHSALKAIKVTCTINASLSALTAALLDIKASKEWVYATAGIALLKQMSPSELIYYSEIDVPWPVNNRDFIVALKVSQDEKTKAVAVVGKNMPDYLPEKKNIVRIRQSTSKWLVTPQSPGLLKIEYMLEVNPGGNIPVWLINLFAAKGPFETLKNLREQVKKPAYNRVSLPFIRE